MATQKWRITQAANGTTDGMQKGSTIQSAQLPNEWTLGGIENGIQVATPVLLATLAGRCQSPHQSM
jgi:hypothetical protein